MSSYPDTMKYTDSHEWVRVDGDVATVGITHHAQDALGDIVHVELPAVGKAVKKGAGAAEVESVKAVSDIYAPISGTVVEVNEALDGNESVVNQDPHGAGWLFKIKLADAGELGGLLDAAAYSATRAFGGASWASSSRVASRARTTRCSPTARSSARSRLGVAVPASSRTSRSPTCRARSPRLARRCRSTCAVRSRTPSSPRRRSTPAPTDRRAPRGARTVPAPERPPP